MRTLCLLFGTLLILEAIDVTSSYKVWRLAQANGKFAFCLYDKVIEGEDGKNKFLSPFSISTALTMTYAGAGGQTAEEMSQVLGFSALKFNVHAIFRATLGSMNAAQGNYILALANALFVDKGYAINPSFPTFIASNYFASFKLLDFHNALISAGVINKWVYDNTYGKITNIVNAGDVADAEVVLANAIYFNGTWKHQFNPSVTRTYPFHVSPNEQVPANMMIHKARFRYSLNRRLGCQILEMPYRGNRLAMYILLPTRMDGLASLESKLTFNSVTSALADLRIRRMSVAIPRFKMTVKFNLPIMLKAMGMKLAFTSAADFNDIGPAMSISDVIHQAFIAVDEKGTEAAAATVVIGIISIPPPLDQDFVANHPFVFLIRDNITGSILFMGRLVKPTLV